MTDKKFNVILAKNQIAREIARGIINKEEMNLGLIIVNLRAIEDYLGTANQPAVNDIIENNTNKDKYQI